jgi:precorrin-6A synthase
LIIGVGAGDPDYITVQAITALNLVDVFFVIDKGAAKDDLIALRKQICDRHIEHPGYRLVEARDPDRDRRPVDDPAYQAAVQAWHDDRTAIFERMIAEELGEDGVGGFLVWGDPALYDGTIRVVEQVLARGRVAFDYQVVPGISAIAALTARHRIPLNRTGEPIHITPGRRLAAALRDGTLPAGMDNVVVMLDAECAFSAIIDPAVGIFWGAYLGTEDEILIHGPVPEVAGEISRARAAARERKGWVMDTYLLRRS